MRRPRPRLTSPRMRGSSGPSRGDRPVAGARRIAKAPATPSVRPGRRVTLTFRAMNLDGSGVGLVAQQPIAVPFALPGEEAVVEVTAVGRRQAEGKIVSLLRKSPDVTEARCRHFGRCGGCQWQHLSYHAQLQAKTQMLADHLHTALALPPTIVQATVGAEPYAYRNRIQATFAVRNDRVVAGYVALDDHTIINVLECPIQHPGNVTLLATVRDVVAELGWPIYDPATRRGLVRGMVGQVGFSSREAMIVLGTTADLPDRMAFVRAVRARLDGLVSIMLSMQPKSSSQLLGRLHLLWGRAYIEDAIAGVRLRLGPQPSIPPNPLALPLWVEAIIQAGQLAPSETVVDVACEDGFLPLAMSPRARRVIGVAPSREAMHRAWDNARANACDNCVFYTRDPGGVLRKLHANGDRVDLVILTSRGRPLTAELVAACREAGADRLVYAGHSPIALATDLITAATAGYRPVEIRSVDLLPQTSHIHYAARLVRTR